MAGGKTFDLSILFKTKDKMSPALKKIKRNFNSLNRPMSAVKRGFDKIGIAAANAAKKAVAGAKSINASFKKIPVIGGMGIGGAAGIIGGASIKGALDFNRAMANVATLIPNNTKRVLELKDSVKTLAVDIGKGPEELSAGLYEVVSAFGDTNESIGLLGATAKAAKAGLADTGQTLNLLSIMMKEYGDKSLAGMTKASDLAFTAVRRGQTSFEALAGSMAQVVPTAAQLGVSQEELFATMATFTRGAATTPLVVTELGAAMSAMLKPTTEMQKQIKALGYESGAAMLKQEGLGGTMKKLLEAAKGDKEQLAAMFGNVRALRMAMKFSGPSMKAFEENLAEMGKASGATNVAFKAQTTGIGESVFAWDQFNAQLKITATQVGDLILPAFTTLLSIVSDILKVFDSATWKNPAEGIAKIFKMATPGMYMREQVDKRVMAQITKKRTESSLEKMKADLEAKFKKEKGMDVNITLRQDESGKIVVEKVVSNEAKTKIKIKNKKYDEGK